MLKKSPLAPEARSCPSHLAGLSVATAMAGIKYQDRTDVLLVAFDPPAAVAGVFTTSRCPGAPVTWSRACLPNGRAGALVVNSGNANAFTGRQGDVAAKEVAVSTANALGCAPEEVFLASTGVIGEPLETSKISAAMPALLGRLGQDDFLAAASAIMTTDTFAKTASATIDLDGLPVSIIGIAKGSGMIAPDMATTLAFVFTDAPVAHGPLQALLSERIVDTFNAITVDSETSTSDTVLLFATGTAEAAGLRPVTTPADDRLKLLGPAIEGVLLDLALQVVKDGEGASKFVTIEVAGAACKDAARKVGLAVANSPLVKTAIAGEDANWGRIVMAVGKCGEDIDPEKLRIWMGDNLLAADGMRAADYDEAAATAHMKGQDIYIRIELGMGEASDRVYTCDLTDRYVHINGSYRS